MSPLWITCAAAVLAAVAAAFGGFLARGSTAVPAAVWATVAALALAVEAAATEVGWLGDPASRASARLVVVALGVCPAMSILGAKKPQHRVWQFIVATLAFVLALPAFTAVLIRPGSMPDLHLIERCFLPLLVVVGWLNYVATRRSMAVSFVAVGQVMLMWAFLPFAGEGELLSVPSEACAAGLIAAGAWLTVAQALVWPVVRRSGVGCAMVIDPPFLALRETLGAAWTLRIAERFNAVAVDRGWPCRLRFTGLAIGSDAASGRWEDEAMRCMRSLLRRFVSSAWLARHGKRDPAVAASAICR